MLPRQHWAHNFTLQSDDMEYLINLLLEQETPLTGAQLARILVEKRLAAEAAEVEKRFHDAIIYNPANTYAVGQRVVFSAMEYATGTITGTRPGINAEHGDFTVLTVALENAPKKGVPKPRHFAADLTSPHKLTESIGDIDSVIQTFNTLTADEVMAEAGETIVEHVDARLQENPALTCVARQWFPLDLIMELNDGHINLAEAVLDIAGGGPLSTTDILEQIGGIGNAPKSLQEFSMNYTLNQNEKFCEVGPAGEILWYLKRMTPPEVRETPPLLRYHPIEYDRGILTEEMRQIEAEICDELSPLPDMKHVTENTVTLTYPHRRSGTLPLNAKVRHIFPFAKTAHIWVTLVDAQDGEEFTGWVVPAGQYVSGLLPLYHKHRVPIGAYVRIGKGKKPGTVVVGFETYKARTEWVRMMHPKGEQLRFEEKQRTIGADYDDLMILGIDDLDAVDTFIKTQQIHRKTLAALLRLVIPELGRLSPQGTAHLATIYSVVNVLRRYPPGPIMAILEANPDFEYVGGHYWKLSER